MKTTGKSPRVLAQLTGLFALLEALTSGFGQVIVPRLLVVPGNATGTAANLLAHAPLLRWSIFAALLGVACHIVWTYLAYELFQAVNRKLAFVSVLFSLVAIALQAFSAAFQAAPVVALQAGATAFNPEQLNTLVLIFFSCNPRFFDAYLVFFGFWCVLIGYLILRSSFMPRVLGFLELMAGMCWLTLIWPPLAHSISPFNQILAAFGETALMLWLLIVGVNPERWKAQACAATESPPEIGR